MDKIKLEPIIAKDTMCFINTSQDLLFESIEKNGSPLNVLFPVEFQKNVALFRGIYEKYSLRPNIFYALKSNRGNVFIKYARDLGIGIETSSKNELGVAVKNRFNKKHIIVSGPIKNDSFLDTAIKSGVIIVVDDASELLIVKELATRNKLVINILLRINYPGSRFGINKNDIFRIIKEYADTSSINLQGFAFHINNYLLEDRASMIEEALDLVDRARYHGYRCGVIDIGGGFTINYVRTLDWKKWVEKYHSGKSDFFYGERLDYIYPYNSSCTKQDYLDNLLKLPSKSGKGNIADMLVRYGVDLYIEPGRSLLDQAGITVFNILGVKTNIGKHPIIIVDGNINSLSEQWFGSEFLVDPILIKRELRNTASKDNSYYIGGNLCLESDMLAKRSIHLSDTPERGDLLIYANTAGYQMDSNESNFEMLDIPTKMVAVKDKGSWILEKD